MNNTHTYCNSEYEEIDMTAQAKWVINCIAETKGRYY
jgi:hypothetical protein